MSGEKEMSFLDHLEELRVRLIRIAIGVAVGAALVFIFKSQFEYVLLAPSQGDFITFTKLCDFSNAVGLDDALCVETRDITIQSVDVAGTFLAHFMVSIIAGIIISFPFIFSQIWMFIKPGLRKREIKSVRGIGFWTSFLFLLGVSFGYFILSPISIRFLVNYEFLGGVSVPTHGSYVKLVASLSLLTGLLFQLPVVIYFLSKIGLVTSDGLRKFRKHVFVGVLVLAALITPPDVFSQLIVSIPILILYEISIKISGRINRLHANESVVET